MKVFAFKPYTNDATPHGQLQEWANHHHVELKWNDEPVQTGGITEITSYPISAFSLHARGLILY
jgi:hypothetical protein